MNSNILRKAACFLISTTIILGYVRIAQAADMGTFKKHKDGSVTPDHLSGHVGDRFYMGVDDDGPTTEWTVYNPDGTVKWGPYPTNPGQGDIGLPTTDWAPGTYKVVASDPANVTLILSEQGVGGTVVPVDKLSLLAPYIALASTILVATAATAIYVKRRKKKQ